MSCDLSSGEVTLKSHAKFASLKLCRKKLPRALDSAPAPALSNKGKRLTSGLTCVAPDVDTNALYIWKNPLNVECCFILYLSKHMINYTFSFTYISRQTSFFFLLFLLNRNSHWRPSGEGSRGHRRQLLDHRPCTLPIQHCHKTFSLLPWRSRPFASQGDATP